MDTCLTPKSVVSNHEIYVPLNLHNGFCLLNNYTKLVINDYDKKLSFNKGVSALCASNFPVKSTCERRI